MRQREKLKSLIIQLCNKQQSRTFSLNELNAAFQDYSCIGIGGQTPHNTVRRLLQELRDENFVSFLHHLGRCGYYTLRAIDVLDCEKEAIDSIDISKETPNKREYLIETYLRNTKLVLEARNTLGRYCLFKNCTNTFITKEWNPYIEVHHIIPLFRGGEDALWNLSVLCAHHHRMAHFATDDKVTEIEQNLLKETSSRIANN